MGPFFLWLVPIWSDGPVPNHSLCWGETVASIAPGLQLQVDAFVLALVKFDRLAGRLMRTQEFRIGYLVVVQVIIIKSKYPVLARGQSMQSESASVIRGREFAKVMPQAAGNVRNDDDTDVAGRLVFIVQDDPFDSRPFRA